MTLRVCDLHPSQIREGLCYTFVGLTYRSVCRVEHSADGALGLYTFQDDTGTRWAAAHRACKQPVILQSLRDMFRKENTL